MTALLTAEDVLNKRFQNAKNGYNVLEVDDFLDDILRTLRQIHVEKDEVESKLSAAEQRIAELSRVNSELTAEVEELKSAESTEKVEAPAVAPEPVDAATKESEMATGIIQMAQKLHDDHVRIGKEEGERLLSEAKAESARLIKDAEENKERTLGQLEKERSEIERKIDELRVFERDYRNRLKSYLSNLLGDLDSRGNGGNGSQSNN